MKKVLILLLLIANLGLGAQNFAPEKLNAEIKVAVKEDDEEKLLSIVKKYPNDTFVLNALGNLYFYRKNYSAAEKYYLRAADNRSALAISYLGMTYIKKGEYEKALRYLKEYEKTIDKNKDYNTDYYYLFGEAYYALKDYKNAKEWYLKSVKFDNEGYSEHRLGIIYRREENTKEASKWYLAAIKKGYLRSYYGLAILYEDKDAKTAEKWTREGIEAAKKANDKELLKDLQEELQDLLKLK
jgi:tetratricopeptide repeat protein